MASKLSLMLMCWNTSYLLSRTLVTLKNQDMDDWELIIIDDKSEDNVQAVLDEHGKDLPIKYHRLEHDMGMRGNTFSINYGLDQAQGEVVMWSTPEVMLPAGTLRAVYNAAVGVDKVFVTIPSHGLTSDIQLRIDEANWRDNLHSIKGLLDGMAPDNFIQQWFNLNFYEHGRTDIGTKRTSYGNNQTVAVNRQLWLSTIGKFPYFLDYGTDDPWVSGKCIKHSYKVLTLWDHEAYHQWHPTCQYWMAQDKAPNWNYKGHTTSNLMNDPKVPAGGTCEIWDNGDRSKMTFQQKRSALHLMPLVEQVGFKVS